MKVQVKVSPTIIVEGEGDTMTEVFESLASLQEVFSNDECGICHKPARFIVREDDEKNKYYEMRCTNLSCRAKLQFGCTKKGGNLFPKVRWDSLSEGDQKNRADQKAAAEKNRGYLPAGGWYKWTGKRADG